MLADRLRKYVLKHNLDIIRLDGNGVSQEHCANCHSFATDHTSTSKCLFDSTYFSYARPLAP